MSLRLRCTVRGCGGELARVDARLTCPRGHAFDRAREGYWNLLQPQDRRSRDAGDRVEAIRARARWLARGFADSLVDAIAARLPADALAAGRAAVDVGCGEGTLTARLLAGRACDACGVDLSAKAVALAARAAPGLTWLVANADRGLPLADGSVDLAVSIFGRRPAAELRRVVRPGGTLVVVLPGAEDLIELRQAAQGEGVRRERVDDAIAQLAPGFAALARASWRRRVPHDRSAIEDALAMSYRGARPRERERLEGLEGLDVTLDAELVVLVSREGVR